MRAAAEEELAAVEWPGPLAEPLDLGAQAVLGVEPGAGDASRAADGVEGDALAGGVHAPQGGDSALACLLGSAAGGPDDVVGVVRPAGAPHDKTHDLSPCPQPTLHRPLRTGNSTPGRRQPVTRRDPARYLTDALVP